MKQILTMEFIVIADAKEFHLNLKKTVSEYQAQGWSVDIQYSHTDKSYTALVIGYVVNNSTEENITITKKEHDRLLLYEKQLDALEAYGVDNWGGYEDAMQSLGEE